MAITNGYATIAQVKSSPALGITDAADDTMIERIVEGVSRLIDDLTGRHFYETASISRYFNTFKWNELVTDDISSASGLLVASDLDGDGTFESTISSTHYNLYPYNSINGEPFTKIQLTPYSPYIFSLMKKGNKITGTFGWAAVPTQIEQACILQSARLFKRFATPLGVQAMSSLGLQTLKIPGIDPDIEMIIKPFRSMV